MGEHGRLPAAPRLARHSLQLEAHSTQKQDGHEEAHEQNPSFPQIVAACKEPRGRRDPAHPAGEPAGSREGQGGEPGKQRLRGQQVASAPSQVEQLYRMVLPPAGDSGRSAGKRSHGATLPAPQLPAPCFPLPTRLHGLLLTAGGSTES